MSYVSPYYDEPYAAEAAASARAAFIRRTYGHLAGAILAFTALETLLVKMTPPEVIVSMITGYGWLFCLGAFMVVSWVADRWARSNTSRGMQYLGLSLYVAAEAVIFLPLLYVAANFSSPEVIPCAAILTLAVFGGLTAAVFVTRHDFSHLRTILCLGSFIALGIIVVSIFIGYTPGLWFSFAMVALASGCILYDTSNVLHHYRTDQHVAAALALFAAVATLFYYILMLLIQLQGGGSRD
ncbi:MAG: US12 family protein [Planctomycetes bacterium]|nr:US12 family protein [Planctomycetota bacterium]